MIEERNTGEGIQLFIVNSFLQKQKKNSRTHCEQECRM